MAGEPGRLRPMIITIDGPAGAGKTTVSRMLAQRLGYRYIDTGALYRGIAVAVQAAGIAADDDAALAALCRKTTIDIVQEGSQIRLLLNQHDVTHQLRTPEITMLASAVSARPVVREFLLDIQRTLGRAGKAVFEGRDMGTVVFPEADAKFFLVADPAIRAQRRYEELQAKSADGPTLDAVAQDMRRRDKNDSTRQTAPLKPAADAVELDSSELAIEEVVESMVRHIKGR